LGAGIAGGRLSTGAGARAHGLAPLRHPRELCPSLPSDTLPQLLLHLSCRCVHYACSQEPIAGEFLLIRYHARDDQPGSFPQAADLYAMYGLLVRSDVPLPIAPLERKPRPEPELEMVLASDGGGLAPLEGPVLAEMRCYGRCHEGRVATRLHQGEDGPWLWHDTVGTFHLLPERRRVEVYPERDVPADILGHVLLGQVGVFAVQRLGRPVLHAGAVITDRGAAVFLGDKGQGKTTMLSAFMVRGHAVLTDDALPLGVSSSGVLGFPGVPVVRLWRHTAVRVLGREEGLHALIPGYDKHLLSLEATGAFSELPASVRAIYLLDRYDPGRWRSDDVVITPLQGRAALVALTQHTALRALLQPEDAARLLPVYSEVVRRVPVRLLSYPSGFEHQDKVYAALLRDLEGEA